MNNPQHPLRSDNTEGSAGSATYASRLSDAIEGDHTHPRGAEDAPTTGGGHLDRAIIIGKDGRWIAGWALRFIVVAIAAALLWKGFAAVWIGLLPVILALLVSTVLWPPVRWLRSKKFPPALAVATVMLGFFAIIGGIIAAITPSVRSQSVELFHKADTGVREASEWIQGPPLNLQMSQLEGALKDVTAMVQERSSQIANGVFAGLSTAGTVGMTFVLMLILTFFFLKDGTRFLPMVRRMSGPNAGWHLTELLSRIWNTLSGFIRTQAIVSLVDATFIGIGLLVLNVPLALVLAILTFFGGFIPIVGAFTAGALAVIVALVSNGVTNALFVLALIIAVQQIEGHVLQPVLQSKAMNLHAAVVLLSVTIGSTLFGVVGAFLAVPVAATVAVIVRYHSDLVGLRAGEITLDEMKLATRNSEERHLGRNLKETLHSISLRKPSKAAAAAEGEPADSTEGAKA